MAAALQNQSAWQVLRASQLLMSPVQGKTWKVEWLLRLL
jgi:hypothetical protein